MAHELLMDNGQAAMMYVGEVPWHGLGTRLYHPPTAAEAIKAAQLDWQVVKKPLYAKEGATWYQVPEQYALVREDLWGTDRCTMFATVAETYTPLQNQQAFEFFDPLIESKAATYETAGALGSGERVWVLAKLGEDVEVAKDDLVQPYLLLFNGHNAQTSVRILFTPIRVVCQNTLSWALQEKRAEFRVHHGRGMHRKLGEVKERLEEMVNQYRELTHAFKAMVRVPMVESSLTNYIQRVFPDPERRNMSEHRYEQMKIEVVQRRKRCTELFTDGAGNKERAVRGSLWAAYNGVTQWADHCFDHTDRHGRFRELFFGDIGRIKSRALGAALDLIKHEGAGN